MRLWTPLTTGAFEEGIPPVLSVVPESQASHLLSRYMYAQVSSVRTWRDYVLCRRRYAYLCRPALFRPAQPHQ